MIEMGLATVAEVEIEILAKRKQDEARANGSVVVGRAEIAAWGRE